MSHLNAPLIMSVSGVRGIVGRSLTPIVLADLASAFAAWMGNRGKVVLGRDSRGSGAAISDLTARTLNLCGVDVMDIGIAPTPTVQLMVELSKAAGGIVVSASHNPIEWNAYKFIKKDGTFLSPDEVDTLFNIYREKKFQFAIHSQVGSYDEDLSSYRKHIDAVLKLVDRQRIATQKFRVLIDSVNGAGSRITPLLLRELGCDVVELHTEINGIFGRGSEPTPENIAGTAARVKEHGCAIGFCQDPDADRLALIDDLGRPLGEEKTLALAVQQKLSKGKEPVVINQSSSRMVEDIAALHQVPFFRSAVGEINVVDVMKKVKAFIGGEGNGGVIDPAVHLGRDSLVGIVLILELMASTGKKCSELSDSLPQYCISKEKFPSEAFADFHQAKSILKKMVPVWHARIDESDGIRFDMPEQKSWLHVRTSNTEPIIRLIAEAPTQESLKSLLAEAKECLTRG